MLAPARKIAPQDWMTAPESRAVMDALNGDNETPKALFVGGCVRNALLGEPFGDIDIATAWRPEDATARLEAAGIKVIPTGADHGTVTAVTNEKSFEITTLRKDVETHGRRATVAFTGDWREDAERRDFTMNTLLADTDGHIYDPTGDGLADLEARRVRFVGAPATRIAEDYLRILRFFRFHAWYGAGTPDKEALAACRAGAGYLKDLSKERVTQECLKLIAADNPVDVLELMFHNNILHDLPHKDFEPDELRRLTDMQNRCNLPHTPARLTVLAHYEETHLAHFERWLVLSNAQRKIFKEVIAAANSLHKLSEMPVKKLIYKYNHDIAQQGVLIYAARREETPDDAIKITREWTPPAFPLTGDDVLAAGIPAGSQIGDILRKAEDWWLAEDMRPGRDACLKKLEALLS